MMKIINITKCGKKYRLDFDNRNSIYILENTLLKHKIIKTADISEQQINNILLDESNEQAFSKALNYLSYGLRSEFEIIDYLYKKGFSEEQVLYSIAKLHKLNYVNDVKFSEIFVKDYFEIKKKGPNYIKRKLIEKGIKEEQIEFVISKICTFDCQMNNIYSIIEKEYSRRNETQSKKIQKITTKLYTNGYSFDIIKSTFENFLENYNKENNDSELIERCYNNAYNRYSKKYKDKYILKQKIFEKLKREGFSYSDIKNYFLKIEI